jgi:hypothetical protein
MEAILKFNLPDDQEDFNKAVQGGDWQHSMWSFHTWLRAKVKHAPDEMHTAKYEAFVETLEQLNEILDYNNVKL